jgi:hypothetical protein
MDDDDDVYCLFKFTLHTHIYLNEFQNKDFDYVHMISAHNMDHMCPHLTYKHLKKK